MSDHYIDKGFKETPKPIQRAKKVLGERLRYCPKDGYKVDGKPRTVSAVLEYANLIEQKRLKLFAVCG